MSLLLFFQGVPGSKGVPGSPGDPGDIGMEGDQVSSMHTLAVKLLPIAFGVATPTQKVVKFHR